MSHQNPPLHACDSSSQHQDEECSVLSLRCPWLGPNFTLSINAENLRFSLTLVKIQVKDQCLKPLIHSNTTRYLFA